MKALFKKLDKDCSGTLSKEEIIAGITSEPELCLRASRIKNLLETWCTAEEMNYDEFCAHYAKVHMEIVDVSKK